MYKVIHPYMSNYVYTRLEVTFLFIIMFCLVLFDTKHLDQLHFSVRPSYGLGHVESLHFSQEEASKFM